MGMCTNQKYPNKELAESFIKEIIESESNSINSELYYRFRTFQLRDYLARKTNNDYRDLDGDLSRLTNGVLYHLKKDGFRKSKYPQEYQKIK